MSSQGKNFSNLCWDRPSCVRNCVSRHFLHSFLTFILGVMCVNTGNNYPQAFHSGEKLRSQLLAFSGICEGAFQYLNCKMHGHFARDCHYPDRPWCPYCDVWDMHDWRNCRKADEVAYTKKAMRNQNFTKRARQQGVHY